VLQLTHEGRHGWIVFERAGGACVVIDPPPALVERIASQVQGWRVAAVLGTGQDADGQAARAALRTALGMPAGDPGPLGWLAGGLDVALDDGSRAASIALGSQVLARLPSGACVLGTADGNRLPAGAVRMAFVGAAENPVPNTQPGTVLCRGVDTLGIACATAGDNAAGDAPQLQPESLERFLRTHEDALLVDVREAEEAAVDVKGLHGPLGRKALNVPLSRLAEHLEHFLAAPRRPLVFFCRSGNRSAKAAQCLRRAGHAEAWTLAGGVALAG
jgi:rhodanese-related sulfurtransferase